MKLRETLLGLLVLAALAGGVWRVRARGHATQSVAGDQAPARLTIDPATEAVMPDITLVDGSVDLWDVQVVTYAAPVLRALAALSDLVPGLDTGGSLFKRVAGSPRRLARRRIADAAQGVCEPALSGVPAHHGSLVPLDGTACPDLTMGVITFRGGKTRAADVGGAKIARRREVVYGRQRDVERIRARGVPLPR